MHNKKSYSTSHLPWPAIPPPPPPAYLANHPQSDTRVHPDSPASSGYVPPPLAPPDAYFWHEICPTCRNPYLPPVAVSHQDVAIQTEPETYLHEHPQRSRASLARERTKSAGQLGRQGPKSGEEKLRIMLDTLATLWWSVGDFMYYLFRLHDTTGKHVSRDTRHRQVVARFLQGTASYTVGDILHCWIDDPMGRPKSDSSEHGQEYSVKGDYYEHKHGYIAITAAAVYLVQQKLEKEIREVVKSQNGLSGSTVSQSGRREITWVDIGPDTVKTVRDIIKEIQPLTWYLIHVLVSPVPRMRNGVLTVRKTRPAEMTATEILASINFSRTGYARLLPAARSMLYFATGASALVFHYSSRVGHTLSWNTTHAMLKRSAQRTAEHLETAGRSPTMGVLIRCDNVQSYILQREQRIGRKSQMKVGMSAFAADILDFDPAALDLDDKLRRVAEDRRKGLTVYDLANLIDHDWFDHMAHIQWMEALVNTVPQLYSYKPKIAELQRTEGARVRLPVRKTHIYSLPTVAEDESSTSEFYQGILKFLERLGQRDGDFTRRLILFGGDGLTFEKLVTLKNYLQFQSDALRRLDIVEPFLEIWHTLWTNLSSIFEAHWGEPHSLDPSRLGHNAAKIGQKPPTDLHKVDYYPASFLAYLVLDARMLDCWRLAFGADDIFGHFAALAAKDGLPSFEELRVMAKQLHEIYTTRPAYEEVMAGDPHSDLPTASAWTPEELASQSAREPRQPNGRSKKPPELTIPPDFTGDQTLAQSMMFMHSAMLCREAAEANAVGDPGRGYECLKYMLFTFAGAPRHPKYAKYLYEQIVRLERESSPALKELLIRNWVVNCTGEAGHWVPGDLTLEQRINAELEEYITRKGGEWDDEHIAEVLAPNIPELTDLKNDWGQGVGLAPRRSHHPEPHSRPEMRILLDIYKRAELHSFRKGRYYNRYAPSVDMFTRGFERLRKSKLKEWTDLSIQARNLNQDAIPKSMGSDSETEDEVDPNKEYTSEDERSTSSEDERSTSSEDELARPKPKPTMKRSARTAGRISAEGGELVVNIYEGGGGGEDSDSAEEEEEFEDGTNED